LDGSLVDGDSQSSVDERTAEQLRNGVWADLGLIDYVDVSAQIGSLVTGSNYVVEVDGDSIYLLDAPGGSRVNLAASENSKSLHRLHFGPGEYDYITLDASEAGIDAINNALLLTSHGLIDGQTVTYTMLNGVEAKKAQTLEDFGAVKESEYDAYWQYRQAFVTYAYDASQEITLSQEDIDRYSAAPYNWDASQLQDLADERTDQYHDLHGDYGSFGDAFDQQVFTSLSAGEQSDYQQYWNYRQTFEATYNYDSDQKITLTQAEVDVYSSAPLNWDAADIEALEQKRTAEYHDLHNSFASVGSVYNESYRYELTADERSSVLSGIKVWSEDELLNLISAGLLMPITDTQAEIETLNITAEIGDITLIADNADPAESANVGASVGYLLIAVDGSFEADERQALASAERTDISFLLAAPISVNDVNFIHNEVDPDSGTIVPDQIQRTDGIAWDSVAGGSFKAGMLIQVFGNSANAADEGVYFEIGAVNGAVITLVNGDLLKTEAGVDIELAQIVPSVSVSVDVDVEINVATNSISRGDGGSWFDDGLSPGQGVQLEYNYLDADDEMQVTRFDVVIASLTDGVITIEANEQLIAINPAASNLKVSFASTINFIRVDLRDDIDLTAGGEINVDADNNVFLGSEQDLRIGEVVAGDSVRIKTKGNIVNAGGENTTNVSASNLILEAGSGGIGGSDADSMFYVNLADDGILTLRANNDVFVTERSNSMNLGTIYSQATT